MGWDGMGGEIRLDGMGNEGILESRGPIARVSEVEYEK